MYQLKTGMKILQNSYEIYNFTLTLVFNSDSVICSWGRLRSTASCNALDRTGSAHWAQLFFKKSSCVLLFNFC